MKTAKRLKSRPQASRERAKLTPSLTDQTEVAGLLSDWTRDLRKSGAQRIGLKKLEQVLTKTGPIDKALQEVRDGTQL